MFSKLDTPIPLGYSCAGKVIEVGTNVSGITVGDRVACGGAGYANHSEINYIPKNLCVRIPENVDDADAAFVTVGSIALQGVRQAEPTLGEKVAVIGLGLIGLLTVQLLKANGCKVLGTDIDPEKLALAKKLGADQVCSAEDLLNASAEFSKGFNVDAVIITASTSSNQPIQDAGDISRIKGRVVVVGVVGMDIPRDLYYKKELDVRLSMSYGPGRYDPNYEEKGYDYPIGYVRWTEQRNFEAFLELINEGKVTPKELVAHTFPFDEALKAYELISAGKEKYVGIVLEYAKGEGYRVQGTKGAGDKIEGAGYKVKGAGKKTKGRNRLSLMDHPSPVTIGMIGAGNFAKSVILPLLKKDEAFTLLGICTTTGVSARPTGDKYGFKYVTTNSNEIFSDPDISTVVITTRHDSHAAYVIKALEAGKHVFVEKPLCINVDELNDIIETYSSLLTSHSSLNLMVGFNRRFAPLIQKMKDITGDRPMAINYRINAGIIAKDSWIQDPEISDGRIVGEVCHFVDTSSYLTGSDPEAVFANCVRTGNQSIPDEDNVSVNISFANGSTAIINYLAYGDRRLPKEHIEVFCGNIAMQLNDFRELSIYKGGKKKRIKNQRQDKGFENELKAFRESITTGIPAISFDSICRKTRATFMILESIRKGEAVKV